MVVGRTAQNSNPSPACPPRSAGTRSRSLKVVDQRAVSAMRNPVVGARQSSRVQPAIGTMKTRLAFDKKGRSGSTC